VLVKVFPIKLKDGTQDKAEAVVQQFAPKGPGAEDGTLSFRVYRDPAKPDYLLFAEHFADQAAYDAHTSSPAYRDLIAGQFANMITEFTELDHELVTATASRCPHGWPRPPRRKPAPPPCTPPAAPPPVS
jgi:quinol monooxygenase YgiN